MSSEWIGTFLPKYCSFDSSSNRNTLTPLDLKHKTSEHVQIAIAHYFNLFINFLT